MAKILKELKSGNPHSALVLLRDPVPKETLEMIKNEGDLLKAAIRVEEGYDLVVKRLFELGANPHSSHSGNHKYAYEKNFFCSLSLPNNSTILQLFLENNVNVNLEADYMNHNALLALVILEKELKEKDKIKKLKLLMKYKINLNHSMDYEDSCALYHSLKIKEQSFSFHLIKRGAEFNKPMSNTTQSTILMKVFTFPFLISHSNLPVLKHIIQNSADLSQKDVEGATLYDIIVRKKDGVFIMKNYSSVHAKTTNKQIYSFLIALIHKQLKQ